MTNERKMTNEHKILLELKRQAPRGVCDDCLAARTGVQPRQTVNQICRRLEAQGVLKRNAGDCAVSHHPQNKIANFLTGVEPPDPPIDDPPPDLEVQTTVLSDWLYAANKLLNRIEGLSSSNESLSVRVSRLTREGRIPSALSRKMQSLNAFRNQVVKERKALDGTEWRLAEKYINETRTEWEELAR